MEEVDDRAVSSRRGSRAASTRIHSATAPAAPKISPSPVSPPDKQSPKYPTQPDTAARDDSPLSSVLDAMEAAYGALKDSKRGLTTTSVLNHIYFAYSFPQYRDGTTGSFKIPVQEVLHYNAAALLQSLDPSKYQGHEIYAFLERLAKTELTLVAYKPSDFPVRLAHRKRVQRQSKKDLLPPPAPAGRTATAHDQRNYDDAASDGTPPAGRGKSLKHEGRRTGKKSFLRPVVTNRKRPHSQLECDSDADAPEPDPSGSHYFDDAMEDAPDAETPRDGHSSDSDQPSSRHETPIKIVIRAEKMPSATPQGPDDTWACEHEGCGYVVRGGDDDECQARIRAHFDDHEQQLERVSLAVTESRGHLTIKYAYFPPFLILVLLDPHAPSPAPAPPVVAARSRSRSASGDWDAAPPDLSGSAHEAFRDLVQQFRRRQHPVSDNVNLTCLQSPSRQDQAHGREVGPADNERPPGSPADQTEASSVTLA